MLTTKRLEEISIGFDLDCGGYCFENIKDREWVELLGEHVCVLDSDDAIEYVLGSLGDLGIEQWFTTSILLFDPSGIYADVNKKWPDVLPFPEWNGSFKLVHSSILNEYDRECYCDNYLDCARCEDGYVLHEGGNYAIYQFEDSEE